MSKAWMPLYIGDYLGDTAHLNQGQHGAYLLLIMHYWQRGPLPADKQECYCIAHAMDQQSRSNADKVLKQFFVLEGDCYRHRRIDTEMVKAQASYEKRVSAAKSRWDKAKHPPNKSNGYALHEQSQSQSQSQSKNQKRGAPSRPVFAQSDFDERDLRRLADARKAVRVRLESVVGCDPITERDYLTAVCEESGLKPKRIEDLDKMTKWAVATA